MRPAFDDTIAAIATPLAEAGLEPEPPDPRRLEHGVGAVPLAKRPGLLRARERPRDPDQLRHEPMVGIPALPRGLGAKPAVSALRVELQQALGLGGKSLQGNRRVFGDQSRTPESVLSHGTTGFG